MLLLFGSTLPFTKKIFFFLNLDNILKESIRMNNAEPPALFQKFPPLVKKKPNLIESERKNEESMEFKSRSLVNKLKLNEKSVRCKLILMKIFKNFQ
jgi:hypothetical protein